MGNYYATHISFKLKPDTPKEIIDILTIVFNSQVIPNNDWRDYPTNSSYFTPRVKELFTQKYSESNSIQLEQSSIEEAFVDFWRMIHSASAYHDSWNRRGVIDELCFNSFASVSDRHFDIMVLVNFFGSLLPWLAVNDEDILTHVIYENNRNERIIFVDSENSSICIDQGVRYNEESFDHPWNADEEDTPTVRYTNRRSLRNDQIQKGIESKTDACEIYPFANTPL